MVRTPVRLAQFCDVPPAGFEPALPPPEGGALSPELRGLATHRGLAERPAPPPAVPLYPPSSARSSCMRVTSPVCASRIVLARLRTSSRCVRSEEHTSELQSR